MGGGGGAKGDAGEGGTKLVPSVPLGTICHFKVTNRVEVTNRVGRTSTLTCSDKSCGNNEHIIYAKGVEETESIALV